MEKLITKEYFNKKTVYPKEEFTFKIYSIFFIYTTKLHIKFKTTNIFTPKFQKHNTF